MTHPCSWFLASALVSCAMAATGCAIHTEPAAAVFAQPATFPANHFKDSYRDAHVSAEVLFGPHNEATTPNAPYRTYTPTNMQFIWFFYTGYCYLSSSTTGEAVTDTDLPPRPAASSTIFKHIHTSRVRFTTSSTLAAIEVRPTPSASDAAVERVYVCDTAKPTQVQLLRDPSVSVTLNAGQYAVVTQSGSTTALTGPFPISSAPADAKTFLTMLNGKAGPAGMPAWTCIPP